MGVKLLEVKNRTYYFWDDTINIENFDPKLLKVDKKESSVGITIYYIRCITKIPVYSINSVNPLYLVTREIEGYVEERENGDRYLNISLVKKNNDVINKFNEFYKGIKDWIFKINGSVKDCDKNYKKTKFDSDVFLPLHTPIKFRALTVVIRCIIEKDNKYFPEIYLDDALFEL